MTKKKTNKNKTWTFKIALNHPLDSIWDYVGKVMLVQTVNLYRREPWSWEYEVVIGRASDHNIDPSTYKDVIDVPARRKSEAKKKPSAKKKTAKKVKRKKDYISLPNGKWYLR